MFDFIKSFGLMTQGGFGANTAGADCAPRMGSIRIDRKIGLCLPFRAGGQEIHAGKMRKGI